MSWQLSTHELRSAWRNVRSRSWRAVLPMVLLALTLATNTVIFSLADSAVFRRVPFDRPEQLVQINREVARIPRGDPFLSATLMDEWRQQTDIFSGVHGYLTKTLFVVGTGEVEMVHTVDVTVGLVELLGTRPAWGRSFEPGDERQIALQPVLIAYELARGRFGSPERALGQRLATSGEPLVVVGVMASNFRFPDQRAKIWRALDPRGPLAGGYAGTRSIARLAPGVSPDRAAAVMAARSEAVAAAAGARRPYVARPAAPDITAVSPEQRRQFLLLFGAAVCLLLIACANVASVELAGALERAHAAGIQLALGATRASLARIAAIEGAIVTVNATGMAAVIARWATDAVSMTAPASLVRRLGANPLDLDDRALLFMAAAGSTAWLLGSLPVVFFAVRADVLAILKLEGSAAATSRGSARIRRLLTAGQVALSVVLLVAGIGYLRSYAALNAQEKGFDSSRLLTVSLTIPPQRYATDAARSSLREQVLERLRALPGVVAASATSAPPMRGASWLVHRMELDDRPPIEDDVLVAELDVDPDYFSTLRIPLLAGRTLQAGDSATDMIVSETFAHRYWPGQDPVGRTYRRSATGSWRRVIGVVGHVRTEDDPPGGRNARVLQTYYLRQPAPSADPGAADVRRLSASGGVYGVLTLMARVDPVTRPADVQGAVRTIDHSLIVSVSWVNEVYASQFEERLVVTRLVSGFAALACLVAAAGIYGVMSFLVAHRSREIGIRVALGASKRDIGGLVLGSALKMVGAGALAGIAGSFVTGRWLRAQFYGVTPLDPLTITGVTIVVAGLALFATWRPARRATRLDPTALLRH